VTRQAAALAGGGGVNRGEAIKRCAGVRCVPPPGRAAAVLCIGRAVLLSETMGLAAAKTDQSCNSVGVYQTQLLWKYNLLNWYLCLGGSP